MAIHFTFFIVLSSFITELNVLSECRWKRFSEEEEAEMLKIGAYAKVFHVIHNGVLTFESAEILPLGKTRLPLAC